MNPSMTETPHPSPPGAAIHKYGVRTTRMAIYGDGVERTTRTHREYGNFAARAVI
jgi:hypothetical protein